MIRAETISHLGHTHQLILLHQYIRTFLILLLNNDISHFNLLGKTGLSTLHTFTFWETAQCNGSLQLQCWLPYAWHGNIDHILWTKQFWGYSTDFVSQVNHLRVCSAVTGDWCVVKVWSLFLGLTNNCLGSAASQPPCHRHCFALVSVAPSAICCNQAAAATTDD